MRSRVAMAGVIVWLMCVTISFAQDNENVRLHKNCKVCGMSWEQFDYSRLLIEYDNGSTAAVCSTRCAAIDLVQNIGRVPLSIRVGDFSSRQLIDAEKAYWVIGGKKEGVMSARGKWAFQKKSDAEGFLAKNGGKIGTFQDALKASFEDMYKDLKTFWDSTKKRGHRVSKSEDDKWKNAEGA